MDNQQEANQNSKTSRSEIEAIIVAKVWQDENFRKQLIYNPKRVISREFDREIPESKNIQVLEESNDIYYLVIPQKPDVEELSEEQLEAVAGGWCNPIDAAKRAADYVVDEVVETYEAYQNSKDSRYF